MKWTGKRWKCETLWCWGLTLRKVKEMFIVLDTNTSSLLLTPHDPVTVVPLGSKFISSYFCGREKRRWIKSGDDLHIKIWHYNSFYGLHTSPCFKLIRRPKSASRHTVLLLSSLRLYFPVVGEGRVGVGVVVGVVVGVAVVWVVGACVVGACVVGAWVVGPTVEGVSAAQEVTVRRKQTISKNRRDINRQDEMWRCIFTHSVHSCCRYWRKPVWARRTVSDWPKHPQACRCSCMSSRCPSRLLWCEASQ